MKEFNPFLFLRCHSKTDKGCADVRTQIWQASFKPKNKSSLVATCGGNKVCLIDACTGLVKQRYTCQDNREIFYCICWGTLRGKSKSYTVLVAGGVRSTLHFIYPKRHIKFFEYKVSSNKKTNLCRILFHPKQENTIFCATNISGILCYQIELDNEVNKLNIVNLFVFETNSEIITCDFCPISEILFAATDNGLQGWHITFLSNMVKPKLLKFEIDDEEKQTTINSNLVDSIEVIRNGIVAGKWALRAFIYIFNTNNTEYDEQSLKKIIPSYILKWKDTDNYFMTIHSNYDAGILTCGDDKGCIWVYDITEIKDNLKNQIKPKYMDCVQIIRWPILDDKFATKSRKLDLDVYDIIIAKAAVHSSGKYIVAVTNNNLICLWRTDSDTGNTESS